MMITEPRWKSYMVETKIPLFTPKQCQMIINAGRSEPRQDGAVGNDKGDGGSGVVILRYAGSQRGTGGTVTSSGGFTTHTFTSSGTFNTGS